jgi:hypothetical protein
MSSWDAGVVAAVAKEVGKGDTVGRGTTGGRRGEPGRDGRRGAVSGAVWGGAHRPECRAGAPGWSGRTAGRAGRGRPAGSSWRTEDE